MRVDSKLEWSYHSLINKTQLLAWLVFQNQWGQEHLKWISPWGHSERLRKCAPYFHCRWHSLTWVSGCVLVWAGECVQKLVYMCDRERLWVCGRVIMCERLLLCVCVSSQSESGKHHYSPPPLTTCAHNVGSALQWSQTAENTLVMRLKLKKNYTFRHYNCVRLDCFTTLTLSYSTSPTFATILFS